MYQYMYFGFEIIEYPKISCIYGALKGHDQFGILGSQLKKRDLGIPVEKNGIFGAHSIWIWDLRNQVWSWDFEL